jgi:hypothetical protein
MADEKQRRSHVGDYLHRGRLTIIDLIVIIVVLGLFATVISMGLNMFALR